MKPLGLYLHIPFCRSKCLYCDFCSFPRPKEETVARYVDALCRDIALWGARAKDHRVDTVYFGGGTPTVLSADCLSRILETVFRHFSVTEDAEITAECNPATGDAASFAEMRRAGFNRLSVGVQSVHANELRALGRIHTFSDVCRTWEDAQRAGFFNLSADVMSGIPEQTPDSWQRTLEAVCALSPTHISSYGLIVEEGTPFARKADTLPLPDEESARAMYFDGIQFLRERGFAQYEISNFSKRGYESRHNLKYWNCDEYLGFGPAAYSDFFGTRFGNSRDLRAYIEGENVKEEEETPSALARANEYVMLRLRLSEGVDVAQFESRFGSSFESLFGKALRRYVPMGLVRVANNRFAFTEEGMYVSNAILSEILTFA